MLRSFYRSNETHIIIDYPFLDDDKKTLISKLNNLVNPCVIEFGMIHTLNIETVDLLYNKLYSNKQNIRFITHTRKLYSYLKKMGIRSQFISLVKSYVVQTDSVERVLIGGSANSSEKVLHIVKSIDIKNLSLITIP